METTKPQAFEYRVFKTGYTSRTRKGGVIGPDRNGEIVRVCGKGEAKHEVDATWLIRFQDGTEADVWSCELGDLVKVEGLDWSGDVQRSHEFVLRALADLLRDSGKQPHTNVGELLRQVGDLVLHPALPGTLRWALGKMDARAVLGWVLAARAGWRGAREEIGNSEQAFEISVLWDLEQVLFRNGLIDEELTPVYSGKSGKLTERGVALLPAPVRPALEGGFRESLAAIGRGADAATDAARKMVDACAAWVAAAEAEEAVLALDPHELAALGTLVTTPAVLALEVVPPAVLTDLAGKVGDVLQSRLEDRTQREALRGRVEAVVALLAEGDLDDLVHEAKSQEASGLINGEGLEEQVWYLIREGIGIEAVEETARAAAAQRDGSDEDDGGA